MAFLNEHGVQTLWEKVKANTANQIKANNETINDAIEAIDAKIPTVLPNPNALTIKGNGTAVETYTGSAAGEVNVVPGSNIKVEAKDGEIKISAVLTGVTVEKAELADKATEADHADQATEANHAATADEAGHANSADNAAEASHAANADEADHATSADVANKVSSSLTIKLKDDTAANTTIYDGSEPKTIKITPAAIGTNTKEEFEALVAEVDKKAPKASPAFTGTPTAPTAATSVNNTQIATTAFVHNLFKANDAMMFKGVINNDSKLLEEHEVGWTYKIGTAGTYAGQKCEVGDMIICVTDGTTANNDHWSVIQNNINGAVTSGIADSESTTDGNIVVFSGTTGKIVRDSGINIDSLTEDIESLTEDVESKLDDTTAIKAGTGISVDKDGKLKDGVTITNAGVHSIATGSTNGTISVNTNGTSADVAVKGLGTAAYKADTYFATATAVDNLSTSKQDKLVNSDDITIGTDNKLTIAVITDDFINGLQ